MTLKKDNILIVDDNYDMLELLQRNLKAQNYHTYKASSVTEALNILKYSAVDLLITDLQMPGINGLELLKYANAHFPAMPKLVITGFPSIDSALSATKLGALEYLIKPFTSEELSKAVTNSLQTRQAHNVPAKKAASRAVNNYAGMVGSTPHFEELVDIIERVKDNKATVIITGESGTGKELIARAIHFKGAFAAGPFVAVNCGALPPNLIESELFGYTKGSFSGANETKKGLFQAANTGTIFLDEIGTITPEVQTRLLRVLQDKEVRMIGSQKPQKLDLRIIAATNSDLYDMVQKGKFREDLYYRLNVVTIETVPLRERRGDIAALAATFLKKYSAEYGRQGITIAPDAMKLLEAYSWPGNVRELENSIQRMIILSDAVIDAGVVPAHFKNPPLTGPQDDSLLPLKDVEKAHILKVLAAVGNNKTRAAEILQIDRKTLRMKLG